jgi:hypothetical protein
LPARDERDDLAILRVLALHWQLFDEGRSSEWAGLFTPEAELTLGSGRSFTGRDALRVFSDGEADEQTRGRYRRKHGFFNPVVDVDRDAARVTGDYIVYQRSNEAHWTIQALGRFEARLIRQGDGWLIAERRHRAI